MLFRRACLVGLSAGLLVVASCGDVERAAPPRRVTPETTSPPSSSRPRPTSPPDVQGALSALASVITVLQPHWTPEPVETVAIEAPVLATPSRYPASYQPCGGEYPPCWRVATESGGDYGAYNPGGCDGHGCFGKWQFSGEWAGKLGLPLDLRTATPQQQDEAALLLWNGGAGCSNWSAC